MTALSHEDRTHYQELLAERRSQAAQLLAEHRERHPHCALDAAAIAAALDPKSPYFITTSRYWDCDCQHDYIRAGGASLCPRCGAEREDMPDARIGEMAAQGIVLDWLAPDIAATLDEHNLAHRPGYPKSPW